METPKSNVDNIVEPKKERPQNKHLKPAKKGEVRNPKGRPVGKRNFDTLVDLAIKSLAEEYVRSQNEKYPNKKITVSDVDIEGDIFRQLVNKARNGDAKMIIDYLDRRHGKATQKLEVGGMNGNPIELSIQVEDARKRAERMLKQWTGKPSKK